MTPRTTLKSTRLSAPRGQTLATRLGVLFLVGCGGYADYSFAPPPPLAARIEEHTTGGETYQRYTENNFVETAQDAQATLSLDVDTASYTLMRRDVTAGRLPDPDGVRVEEFVNFFRYDDREASRVDEAPFEVSIETAPSPFGEGMSLLRVGIQGITVPTEQRPPANLVFLIDVSGSMNAANKLPLVRYSLITLANSLQPNDTIAIVTYAGQERVALPPTAVAQRGAIMEAIESLQSGGGTNAESGIRMAYDLATQNFRSGGINRVILCTDGDFNIGLTGDALFTLIEQNRDRGVTLTTLGFGEGNYHDHHMEQLADRGNGNYAYIDNRNEALRVLSRDLSGTLHVIAKDVKIQVEFDPEVVRRFRLIGYENRVLAHEDFTNDQVDAAEIGSGQFTTAFFEYELVEQASPSAQLAEVRIRYKLPEGTESTEVTRSFAIESQHTTFEEATPAFRFGAAVVEFAEILRRSQHVDGARFPEILEIARNATWDQSNDPQEFLTLVANAQRLWVN